MAELYQYSILSALMAGIADTGIPASQLKDYSVGLGTFKHIDGEMILLDGHTWQLKSDGSVREAAPDEIIPFVMATDLSAPEKTFKTRIDSKETLHKALLDQYRSKNLMIAYRIDAASPSWKRLKVRTVGGQQHKGQKLSELAPLQTVMDFDNIQGTLIGFYSPDYLQGISVAGEHLHFISKDRSCGGHVLELEAEEVEIQASVIRSYKIDLPAGDADFREADLGPPDSDGIKKVEG